MPNSTTKAGVALAGWWRPNIECWFGSFVIFQGIRTSVAKKPYIFVIFQGGGSEPPAPSPPLMDPHMTQWPPTYEWLRAVRQILIQHMGQ